MKNKIRASAIIFAIFIIITIGALEAYYECSARSLNNIEIVSGTVRHISAEGGFWGITADNGKKYEPLHLPLELRRPGLKVEFTVIVLRNNFSVRMWGTPVEILDYKIIH